MGLYRIHGSFDEDIEADSEEEAMGIFEDTYTFGEFMDVQRIDEDD